MVFLYSTPWINVLLLLKENFVIKQVINDNNFILEWSIPLNKQERTYVCLAFVSSKLYSYLFIYITFILLCDTLVL